MKTKAILLSSARYIISIRADNAIVLELKGTPIKVNQVVNLGLTSSLSWNEVKSVSRRINGLLNGASNITNTVFRAPCALTLCPL